MEFFVNETNMTDYNCFIRPSSTTTGKWNTPLDVASIYYQNKKLKNPVFSAGYSFMAAVEEGVSLSAGVITEPGLKMAPLFDAIVGMRGKYVSIDELGPVDILVMHKTKNVGFILKYVIINEDGGGMDIVRIKKEHQLSFFAGYGNYYSGSIESI